MGRMLRRAFLDENDAHLNKSFKKNDLKSKNLLKTNKVKTDLNANKYILFVNK